MSEIGNSGSNSSTSNSYSNYRDVEKKILPFVASKLKDINNNTNDDENDSQVFEIVEHQIDRHFTIQELEELYAFEPNVYNEEKAMTLPVPDDYVLADIILQCKRWILRYHEHDSLLENRRDEILSDEDRKKAWLEYESEKISKGKATLAHLSKPDEVINYGTDKAGPTTSTATFTTPTTTSTNSASTLPAKPAINTNMHTGGAKQCNQLYQELSEQERCAD